MCDSVWTWFSALKPLSDNSELCFLFCICSSYFVNWSKLTNRVVTAPVAASRWSWLVASGCRRAICWSPGIQGPRTVSLWSGTGCAGGRTSEARSAAEARNRPFWQMRNTDVAAGKATVKKRGRCSWRGHQERLREARGYKTMLAMFTCLAASKPKSDTRNRNVPIEKDAGRRSPPWNAKLSTLSSFQVSNSGTGAFAGRVPESGDTVWREVAVGMRGSLPGFYRRKWAEFDRYRLARYLAPCFDYTRAATHCRRCAA